MKLSTDEIRRIKRDNERYDDAPSLKEVIETMEETEPDACETCGCRHSDGIPCGVDQVSRGI